MSVYGSVAALRREILDLYEEVARVAGADLADASAIRLRESRSRLASDVYTVTVCGEYSRGKSSLVNALIGRPDLLPVGIRATTSAIATVRWGAEAKAAVRIEEEDGRPVEQPVPFAALARYGSQHGNPRNRERVRSLDVAVPSPLLRRGLVLVDTPGIGTLYPEHTAITNALLPRTDGILFVCNVIDPLSKPELEFLRRAERSCPTVLVAATKADRIYDAAGAVADIAERIGGALDLPEGQVRVVAVSAVEREAELAEGREDGGSGFAELERELWNGLAATCIAPRIERALGEITAVVRESSAPVVNEFAGMGPGTDLGETLAHIARERARAAELRGPDASWRADLGRRVAEIERELRVDLDRRCQDAKRDFKAQAENPAGGSDARQLLGQVCTEIGAIVDEVEAAMIERTSRAAAEIAERIAVPLMVSGAGHERYLPAIAVPGDVLGRKRNLGWLRTGFESSMAAGAFGATIGALVTSLFAPGAGSVIGGVVGGLLFNIIGFVSGATEQIQEDRGERRTLQVKRMVRYVVPALDREILEIGRRFDAAVKQQRAHLEDRVESEVERSLVSLEASVRRLEASSDRDARDLERHLADLRRRTEEYRLLGDRLTALHDRLTRL
ncbi:Dynamin family protein [Glycomyces sambucus]|uniref:Dynamin family protein n=1 Tax=Glycomyces sambucus TaxID=380244 RepID=A0A1G9D2D6_9ACTN|nr:dynamin family protein [Glycomyces sambucus]SDK57815.1 Dynamin family protein [Glycomyces sambucus]